jgi:hypothetical protein
MTIARGKENPRATGIAHNLTVAPRSHELATIAEEMRHIGTDQQQIRQIVVSSSRSAYAYSVERDFGRPGYAEVSLVRRPARDGPLARLRHGRGDAVVLFHRTFRPMFELAELEAYASQLQQVVRHADEGTLGCFVETTPRDGSVQITLYERWFDGDRLRCERLAQREFDASEDGTLVASAEFLAELEAWVERRNDEREARDLDASAADAERAERSLQRSSAADELARILESER